MTKSVEWEIKKMFTNPNQQVEKPGCRGRPPALVARPKAIRMETPHCPRQFKILYLYNNDFYVRKANMLLTSYCII